MKVIGIIIAMDKELAPIIKNVRSNMTTYYGKEFYSFKEGDTECVVVKSGIGKVNAAFATTLLVEKYKPNAIISVGISGGLGRCELEETVLASSIVQHDVDTTALGDELGFVSTVGKIYFDTDESLTDELAKIAGNARKVILASGDKFVADEKTKNFITDNFDASACDMESGAIAQVACITNTPFAAIRCISDGAGENAQISFEELIDKTSEKLAAVLLEWIKNNRAN